MEALTRLVSESLARHGFDRPVDYRRLKWSRWLRCESHHSLLFVPSKPGVFALAEEITHAMTAAPPVPRSEASGLVYDDDRKDRPPDAAPGRALAVTQFLEADDMAFILDRMLSRYNPMRARLVSGRYFVRFVVIEDESQRRNISEALNQWIHSSAEKTAGIGGHFATSLELTPLTEHMAASAETQADLFSSAEMGRVIFSAHVARVGPATATEPTRVEAPQEPSRAAEIQSPPVFPSGF
jgi:hypothetical protein